MTLTSPELGRRVSFTWPTTDFPFVWCWFVYGGHPDWPLWGQHRLLTIEPFSCGLTTLHKLVNTAEAASLSPFAVRSTRLAVEFGSVDH
jgi:hypothetical protein